MKDRRRNAERGATAVLAAVLFIVVGAFLALSLNVGNMMHTRSAAQAAVDSGALAGAGSLDGTGAGLARARDMATKYTTRHAFDKDPVTISATDIETGIWNGTAFGPSVNPLLVNAIRVSAGRDTSGNRNTPLPVYFGAFLGGQKTVNVGAKAVAVGGGPGSGCSVPLVLAECLVKTGGGGPLNCGGKMVFSDSNIDSIGFTNLEPGSRSVNNNDIRAILNGTSGTPGCTTDPVSGLPCCPLSVDDELAVQNGNDLNKQVEDAFEHPTNGPAGGYICSGNYCPVVTVAVVNLPCPGGNPKFNGVYSIAGFASFTITKVESKPRSIEMSMTCDRVTTDSAGGGNFGTTGRPRLIQ